MTDAQERQNLTWLMHRSRETISHAQSTIRQAEEDLQLYEAKLRALEKRLLEQEYGTLPTRNQVRGEGDAV
jgi:hypothetical protein